MHEWWIFLSTQSQASIYTDYTINIQNVIKASKERREKNIFKILEITKAIK